MAISIPTILLVVSMLVITLHNVPLHYGILIAFISLLIVLTAGAFYLLMGIYRFFSFLLDIDRERKE